MGKDNRKAALGAAIAGLRPAASPQATPDASGIAPAVHGGTSLADSPIFGRAFKKHHEQAVDEQVIELPLSLIDFDPDQPRKLITDQEIVELADTIRPVGIIQPVGVQAMPGGRFKLLYGERRVRAVTYLQWQTIRAIIRSPLDPLDVLLIQFIENSDSARKGITALEEAMVLAKMAGMIEGGHVELARRLNTTEAKISKRIALATLPPPVDELLRSGTINDTETALGLGRLVDGKYKGLPALLARAQEGRLHRQDVAEAIKKMAEGAKGQESKASRPQPQWVINLETALPKGITVAVKGRGKIASLELKGERKALEAWAADLNRKG